MLRRPQAKNYQLLSRTVKIFSVLVVFILLAVIAANLFIKNSVDEQTTKVEQQELQKKIEEVGHSVTHSKNEIQNPKLMGIDRNNNPYSITAQYGYKIDENTSFLKVVTAEFTKENTLINVKSDAANIEAEKSQVDLQGNIELTYNNDTILNADNATVDYKLSSASGSGNVILNSRLGVIKSDKFSVSENYESVVFEGGRVHTNLKPAKSNEKSQ